MIAAVLLVIAVLVAATVLLIFVGVWSTILVIGLVFAVALLIRVILTGKWSDTTWFGKLVTALARALGANVDVATPTGEDHPSTGED